MLRRVLALPVIVWALFPVLSRVPAGATFVAATDIFVSSERAITDNVGSPSDCTASQIVADSASRSAVDAQNDGWEAAAASRGFTVLGPVVPPSPTDPDRVDVSPTSMAVPGSSVVVDVSFRNVPHAQLGAFNPAAVGSPALGTDPNAGAAPTSYRNPYTPIPADGTMQDCAPYPESLYDTSSIAGLQPERLWNALYGSGTDLDGALFEFSSPVAAFGAWFGDLETRPGTPAYVKLIAADGSLVWEGEIPASIGPAPTSAECGGPAATDPLACGNQTTRWIGFVTQAGDQPISKMLVTVGDDDDCTQVPASQCDGSTEHLSWVGAMIAEPLPVATTTSSSTTSTTTTTTTSTTTTMPDPTTTTTTTPTTSAPVPTTTTTPAPAPTWSIPDRPDTTVVTKTLGVDQGRDPRPAPQSRQAPPKLLAATGSRAATSLVRLALGAVVIGALLVPRRRRSRSV